MAIDLLTGIKNKCVFIYLYIFLNLVGCLQMNQPVDDDTTRVSLQTTTMAKVATMASFNPDVASSAVNTQRPTHLSSWCSCLRRCCKQAKTSLVVETVGENHSLLPNHLNQNSGYVYHYYTTDVASTL